MINVYLQAHAAMIVEKQKNIKFNKTRIDMWNNSVVLNDDTCISQCSDEIPLLNWHLTFNNNLWKYISRDYEKDGFN